ncbi:WbqC family protein [Shewanella sp. TC10]|uniref:WbqC family protein n=1 Tax=Shewanella sp. TC10 TaxID=1419739 RepID=UPI00129D7E0D|nr:WbqC family protein [Shewanella sp. TC10]
MKIAIMQPYFFPYLGYFQLINSVDKFVILDNVQYIDSGWINRNQLESNGRKFFFTIPVRSSERKKMIKDVKVCKSELSHFTKKFKKTLTSNFSKSPNYVSVFNEIDSLLSNNKSDSILEIAEPSIIQTCQRLGITTPIVRSSSLTLPFGANRQDRVIDIVKELNCTHYLNPIGGDSLYDTDYFTSRGVKLDFFKPELPIYKRGDNQFVSGLSCIDYMMWQQRVGKLNYD